MINVIGEKIYRISQNIHLKDIFAGSSIALTFNILGVVGGYFFSFIVSRNYGTVGMGLYGLSFSVLLVLEMLSTMGFRSCILRFVSQYYAERKFRAIKGLYKQIILFSLPVSIFFAAILWFFSFQFSVFIFHNILLKSALQIISIIIPFYVINSLNIELIRSLRNIFLSEYLRNLNKPLFGILILLVLTHVFSNCYIPIIALAFSFVTAFLISTFYIKIKLGPFAKDHISLLSNKELMNVSFPMMIASFSFMIMGYFDTLMLGMFSTIENVGIYNIAARLASVTSFILFAINIIAAPKISELYWSNKHKDLREIVNFSTKLGFWISLPILLAYLSFPKFFMGVFGSEFIKGNFALVLLTIGQFVGATTGIAGQFLNMTGKQKALRNIVLTSAGIDIILCRVLIPRYGVNGAAISTMISMIFWNVASVVVVNRTEAINAFYIPLIARIATKSRWLARS